MTSAERLERALRDGADRTMPASIVTYFKLAAVRDRDGSLRTDYDAPIFRARRLARLQVQTIGSLLYLERRNRIDDIMSTNAHIGYLPDEIAAGSPCTVYHIDAGSWILNGSPAAIAERLRPFNAIARKLRALQVSGDAAIVGDDEIDIMDAFDTRIATLPNKARVGLRDGYVAFRRTKRASGSARHLHNIT